MANALDRFIAGAWLIKGLDDGVHSTQPLLREVGRADSFVQFTALGGTAISNPCVKSSLIGRPSDGTKTPRLCSFRLARGVHDSESCFSSRPMINTRSPSLSYSSYTVGDGNTRRRLNTVSCVPTRSGDGSRSFRLFRFHVSEAIPPPRNPSDTCSSSSNSSMCLWNLLIENRRCVCVCDFRLFIPWIRSPKCLCPRETTTTKQWRRWSAEALSYWPDMQLSSSCSSYQVGRRRKTQHRSSFCSPFLLFISFRGQ